MDMSEAMQLLGVLVATGCLLLAWMAAETHMLRKEHVTLASARTREPSPIRVAFLSDLHMKFLYISPERIRRILAEQRPDLLLIAGDVIDGARHIAQAEHWLRALQCACPILVCPGNHDNRLFNRNPSSRRAYVDMLERVGAGWLCNESRLFTLKGSRLLLTGLDEPGRGRPDIAKAIRDRAEAVDSPEVHTTHLLMTHNPELLLSLPERFADVALAGHFHGGQIWMPFGLEFRLFRRESIGRMGVRRGLHVVRGMTVYVSRGLGNTLIPFRLGCRPEITILEL